VNGPDDRRPPTECDLVVVGAGIVGLAVARELLIRHPGARLCVLEAGQRIGEHQTGRSSGVIHAGIYYRPGSLKARLCVQGARELYEYCDEHGVEYAKAGKLIVAAGEGQLAGLDELERRGEANGVEGLRRLSADEIREVEPEAAGVAALHSPGTGIVDFVAVAESYAADVARSGGTVHFDAAVAEVEHRPGAIRLRHAQGNTQARTAVFCAGLWSDRLAVACGAPMDPQIVPFRGAYLEVTGAASNAVRGNVYPVPNPNLPFLGAHLTRTLDRRLLIGPSALIAPARDAYRLGAVRRRDLGEMLAWPGTRRLAARHWRAGLHELRQAIRRRGPVDEAACLVPALAGARVTPAPPGIRAQALARDGTLVDDFVIHRTEHAVHLRNAPSPAATSSLPLARLIADRALGAGTADARQ
jgi:2-hydroxyglutarate dehydrogenase